MIARVSFLLLRRSRRSRNDTLLRATRSGIPTPKPTPMPTMVVGLSDERVPWIEFGWLTMESDGADVPDLVANA